MHASLHRQPPLTNIEPILAPRHRLDLVIAAAASTGIRLVLVFTNFEPFYGGIQVSPRNPPQRACQT